MDRQQEFEGIVEAGLERFRKQSVTRMREILGRDFPPDVRVIWFGIQSDTDGLPVRVYGMDSSASNTPTTSDPKTGASRTVLSEALVPDAAEEYIPYEVVDDYNNDLSAGAYEHAARLIAEFLRSCYQEAGGAAHPLRAYANHHDRGGALDLKTGKWVKVADIQRSDA